MRALEDRYESVADYEKYCAGLGLDPAEVALAWVLGRPGLTGAVIGPRTLATCTVPSPPSTAPRPRGDPAPGRAVPPPVAGASPPAGW